MKTKPSGYGMPVVCLRYYMEKVEVDHSLGLQSSGRKFPFGSRFACTMKLLNLKMVSMEEIGCVHIQNNPVFGIQKLFTKFIKIL